jgi:hypothetical protein
VIELQPGDRLGRWEIVKLLRKTATGTRFVCKPVDGADSLVVIRTLTEEPTADGIARIEREAELLSRLDHPGLPRLIEFVREPCMVVQSHQPGVTLMSIIASKPLGPKYVEKLAVGLLDVLDYLQRNHVLHRGIKPESIFLCDAGHPLLFDQGIAVDDKSIMLTGVGLQVGTLRYMPPEFLEGETQKDHWDLYALGVILYEALTGNAAFGGLSQRKVLVGKRTLGALDPGPGPWPGLQALITGLTALDPDRRAKTVTAARNLLGGPATQFIRIGRENATNAPKNPRHQPGEEPPPAPVSQSQVSQRGVILFAGLAVFGAAGLILFWLATPEPTVRDVRILFSGMTGGESLNLTVNGFPPSTTANDVAYFDSVALGQGQLQALVGKACDVRLCPGFDCSACCFTVEHAFNLETGSDALDITLALQDPPVDVPQTVRVSIENRSGRNPISVILDEGENPGQSVGTDVFEFKEVATGEHDLLIKAGRCPKGWDGFGRNTRRCMSDVVIIDVPCGNGLHNMAIVFGDPDDG